MSCCLRLTPVPSVPKGIPKALGVCDRSGRGHALDPLGQPSQHLGLTVLPVALPHLVDRHRPTLDVDVLDPVSRRLTEPHPPGHRDRQQVTVLFAAVPTAGSVSIQPCLTAWANTRWIGPWSFDFVCNARSHSISHGLEARGVCGVCIRVPVPSAQR